MIVTSGPASKRDEQKSMTEDWSLVVWRMSYRAAGSGISGSAVFECDTTIYDDPLDSIAVVKRVRVRRLVDDLGL